MNEFLKLEWLSTSNSSYLEEQTCFFIPDEVLLDSYVYQNLKKRLPISRRSIGKQNKVNFVPGIQYQLKIPKKSSLSKAQQENCLHAMKLLRQNKNPHELKQTEKYSLEQFEKLNSRLMNENSEFQLSAKTIWERERVFISTLQNNLHHYGHICFSRKFKRYLHYGNFYKEIRLISMSHNESEIMPQVNCIKNLLQLGTLARFSRPSLKIECRLRGQSLPRLPSGTQTNSKLPVSEDENIRKLLQENDIDVVISSSGLNQLLDNTDLKAQWYIPVKIETITTSKGSMKKVIFVDKPLVQKHPDPLELKYYSMKRLVKTNLCQYEAFKYENQDKESSNLQEKPMENDEINEEDMPWRRKKKGEPNVIHHNVDYRVWKFQMNVDNKTLMKNSVKNTELNVLVRSKLDACEEVRSSGTLQPVILKPKVELQLEYGASIPTKTELSREWTSLFFRPFSTLYRVRMHWKTAEVVSIENCTIQKVTSEATSLYQYNPHLGLERLNHLLNELVQLEAGNYLLVHLPKYESFIGLWAECENAPGVLDLKAEYENCQIDDQIRRNWIPLDLNYILPIHEFLKRPPGCFTPYARLVRGFKKKKASTKPKGQSKEVNKD